LREKLRSLGYVPMVFNFDKPATKDFTETVRLLANLSHFVIVDITNPRSAPLELQATVPDYMVPFVPILEEGQAPFSMFVDLQNKYDWVLDVIAYPSVDRLIDVLEDKIARPAENKIQSALGTADQPTPRRAHLMLTAKELCGLELLDTARAVAEFDLPMRVLGLWWGNP
jgi:hypothetical protein